jgi:hypothetical protein
MISVCTACEQMFNKKLKRMAAYEFPQVKCKNEFDPENCYDLTCRYYFYEDCEGDGCTEFLLCDDCLKDEIAIKKMLENYDNVTGF